jgi:hypothetical protein
MTGGPQFKHKSPRFFRAGAYNVVVASLEQGVLAEKPGRNDVFILGLMALPERGVAAGKQMGFPQ